METCSECTGLGVIPKSLDDLSNVITCEKCDGSGQIGQKEIPQKELQSGSIDDKIRQSVQSAKVTRLATDADIWLTAWLKLSERRLDPDTITERADACLKDYKERFSDEENK